MNNNQARIYLLRHGEVTPSGLLAGRTNLPLSTKGWQQLEQATSNLADIELCFSSPLSRCLGFAEKFIENQHSGVAQTKLVASADLQEMHFGDWDGERYEKLWAKQENSDICIGDFWQNPWQITPPQGETMAAFDLRVKKVWQDILQQAQGKNVLVVSHAGVIKQIIAEIIGLTMPSSSHLSSINIGYGSLLTIDVHYESPEQGGNIWPFLSL